MSFGIVPTRPASATCQWVMVTTTADSTTTSTTLVDDDTFSGATTSVLTINNPDLLLNDRRFCVVVTDSSGTTVSAKATLHVYAAPSLVPTVTVSPATALADRAETINVHVSALPAGTTVRVDRFLDANADGQIGIGELDVQSATLTDGLRTSIAGVQCPLIPCDGDDTADGSITASFPLGNAADFARATGNYLVRVSSPDGLFRPIVRGITLTEPAQAQTVSGQVLADGTPVPFAIVSLFATDATTFITAGVADATGHYSIQAPVGNAKIVAFSPGFTATPTGITITAGNTLADTDLTLRPGGSLAVGDFIQGSPATAVRLPGVQLLARSNNGDLGLTFSHEDGSYSLGAFFNSWTVIPSAQSLNSAGYVRPEFVLNTGSDILVAPANAIIHGSIKAIDDTPVADAPLQTRINSIFSLPVAYAKPPTTGYSDAQGNYVQLVNSGTTVGSWQIGIDGESPALTGYLPLPPRTVTLLAGEAKQVDFTVSPAPVRIRGRLTLDSVPLPGIRIAAEHPMADDEELLPFGSITDADGSYDLALTAGTWSIRINQDSAITANILGSVITHTVADGNSINDADIVAKSATHRITGSVKAWDGALFWSGPRPQVSATATVDGVNLISSATLTSENTYSLPVIDGVWHTSVTISGHDFTTDISIADADVAYDFVRPAFADAPADVSIFEGQDATFHVTAFPSESTYQWQSSMDGTTWTDLGDDTTYAGTTTETLMITAPPLSFDERQYRLLATTLVQSLDDGVLLIGDGTPVHYPSASARLTVNPVDTFDAWRQATFSSAQLADPAISGPTASPANDGVANLLKYAFNLPALSPSAFPALRPVVTGNTITLEFDAIRSDVTYAVEASTDLVNWTTAGVTTHASGTHRTASYDTTNKSCVFLRLTVSP